LPVGADKSTRRAPAFPEANEADITTTAHESGHQKAAVGQGAERQPKLKPVGRPTCAERDLEARMPHLNFDVDAALGVGREATALTFAQISLRGIIVFVATLTDLRKRE